VKVEAPPLDGELKVLLGREPSEKPRVGLAGLNDHLKPLARLVDLHELPLVAVADRNGSRDLRARYVEVPLRPNSPSRPQ
jgi:hypothetical protein